MRRWLFGDKDMFVVLDAASLKDAEEREHKEMRAQSSIVRHAQVDHSAWWRMVEARRAPRLRLVTEGGGRG